MDERDPYFPNSARFARSAGPIFPTLEHCSNRIKVPLNPASIRPFPVSHPPPPPPTELSARAVMNLWPYGRLGNPETGIDWGQVQTTWKGRSTLTDLLTDGTNNWRFVNGHLMELTPVEGQE